MKKLLLVLLVLFLPVSFLVAETMAEAYFADFPGSRIIPADKVFDAIENGDDFIILDIRKAEDYAKGHLEGAINAPWGPAIADAIDWLPDDIPVYVGCYSGQTAGQTVAVLNTLGIQTSSIKYGWNLGVSKTDGYKDYIDTYKEMAPEESGIKFNVKDRAAAEAYFNAIPKSGSNIIAAAKLNEMITGGQNPFVVSIRKAEDYAKGHIKGAINIPFGKGMQAKFSRLSKNEKVYVYCYSGQTAGQTTAIMRLMGYDAVSVKSGMGTSGTGNTGWGNEGFDVVK